MLFKSVLLSTLIAVQALAENLAHQEIVTVTKTTHISNPCLENYAKKLLPNNPTGLTTGIPIVIVYAPQQPDNQVKQSELLQPTQLSKAQQQQQIQGSSVPASIHDTPTPTDHTKITVTSTTICNQKVCTVKTFSTIISHSESPTTTTTTTKQNEEKSIADTKSFTHKALPSSNGAVTLKTTSVKTALTTTSTVFSATSLPSTTYTPSTSVSLVSTTKKNPVSSQSVVSTTKTISINTSLITDAVTITKEATTLPNSKHSSIFTNGSISFISTSANKVKSTVTSDISNNSQNGSSLSLTSTINQLASITNSTLTTITKPTSLVPDFSYTNSSRVSSTMRNSSEESSMVLEKSSSKLLSSTSFLNSSSIASTTESSELVSATTSDSSLSHSSSSSVELSSSLSSEADSSSSSESVETGSSDETASNYSGDLFKAIDTNAPPTVFARSEIPLTIPAGVDNNGKPIGTNKFYTNLLLGNQDFMVYPLPYGLYWSKTSYYGFAVQHNNVSDRVFGSINTNNKGVASYYFNPTNNAELIFSATSFSKDSMHMKVSQMAELSALVTLSSSSNDESNYLDIPLVQGMGFVTGIYNGNLTPLLNSLFGVKDLSLETSDALLSNVLKYRATLLNNVQWLIYVTLPDKDTDFKLEVEDFYNLKGSKPVDGLIIQVAIAPEDNDNDKYYDAAAGMYVTGATVLGSVSQGTAASYKFSYTTAGKSSSNNPIVFALPHHMDSLTGSALDALTGITVTSTTKGEMTGFLTNELEFSETINQDVEFLPWTENMTGSLTYTKDQLELLASAANKELAANIAATVKNMNSNYFSGKVLDKYAQILLVVSEIIQDEEVTKDALNAMKDAFKVFTQNKQYYPLMYDTKFGGVTSTSAQDGDPNADFGSAYYNDHDFHYGYFIHAAAIVGYVDKKLGGTWAQSNKDWVNSLVRDASNPSADDTYFPVSRMFDWFSGHSWATGLFVTYKNIESSSESLHFAAAIKLWGKVVGDQSMEARGGLMISIMARSFNMYFYYKSDNTVEPKQILPNKVSGIFFENKVDYTTFFGTPADHPEYVHGIHMLPITPSSSLVRKTSYVQEEWKDQIAGFIDNVDSGWTGILRLNQALFDPKSSYEFFASNNWDDKWLDNGQSRTWSLAFAAGALNAS